MHYYQFNIGDYRKDTAFLSLLEHGIYRTLLDTYYLDEQPLSADDDEDLMRTHNVRSEEEKNAFLFVLRKFFTKTKKGYVHKKCEEELQKILAKSEKARASAKCRWDANAMRTECETDANGMLPNTHNPIPNNIFVETDISTDSEQNSDNKTSPLKTDKPPPCPHLEIIELYHRVLPELPNVVVSRWQGSARAKDLQTRWKESPKHQTLEFWERFFIAIRKIDWYFPGQGNAGIANFSADLGWLLKRSNFDKTIERLQNLNKAT